MFTRTARVLVAAALTLLATAFAAAQTVPDAPVESGYAPVNGLEMYYEIYGEGEPLVVLHGAYMNIRTLGGLIASLAGTRQVIAVELQGHGRTNDLPDRPISYEQLADDVAALMAHLGVEKADVFGYSLGGSAALQVAIRHPEIVDKLVVASATFSSDGFQPGLVEMIGTMTPEMFAGTPIISEYEALSPHPDQFPVLMEKLKALDTVPFAWPLESIQSIQAPTLVIAGDSDAITLEHAVELFKLLGGGVNGDLTGLPASQLAVLPASTHISVVFRVDALTAMIVEFLDGTTQMPVF